MGRGGAEAQVDSAGERDRVRDREADVVAVGAAEGEMVTPAVAVSRLFFENKVKAITASLPSSPRTSLTLPKRDWGYSPYASTSFDPPKRCLESSPLDPSSHPADCSTESSSGRPALDQPSSFRSAGTGTGAGVRAGGGGAGGGKQGGREEEVLRAMDFAERKAFFQSNKGGDFPKGQQVVCKGGDSAAYPPRSAVHTFGCGTDSSSLLNRGPEGQQIRDKEKEKEKEALHVGEREREFLADKSSTSSRKGSEDKIAARSGSGSGVSAGAMSVKDIVSSWSSVIKERSALRGKGKA